MILLIPQSIPRLSNVKATLCYRPVNNNGASVTYKALWLHPSHFNQQGELESHFPSLQEPFEIGGVDNKEANFRAPLVQSTDSDAF